ncbi:hypothetical protein EHS13_03710 [Paenibacillus psychroresistens]|uniref:TATA-box binding protein n=1 Tax=Paenibacillus psychroresistens TaxID=1778678 RepID=A0A6B8REY2_9BACL|nr:YwmB family TATA-box binding protein [Paenibacillus psychroresistens]QGQ94073.1 hypothetical protein EHS13_03710 [Paenibacillus psychroresistens]
MRRIGLLVLTVLIISTIFITWKQKNSETEELATDTQTILELSQPYLQEGYSFDAKWIYEGAGYVSLPAFQAFFDELNQKLNFQSSGKIDYSNGLPVLRGSSQLAEGAQLQSMLVGSKDQQSSLWILTIIAAPPMTMELIVQAQLLLTAKLADMGFIGAWNTMVQGTLTDLGTGNNPEAFIYNIVDQIQGNQQEVYQDGQTVSVSIYSKKMQAAVQSGNHKVNLQMALHQNSVTKAWRFTIGSPLITIEY